MVLISVQLSQSYFAQFLLDSPFGEADISSESLLSIILYVSYNPASPFPNKQAQTQDLPKLGRSQSSHPPASSFPTSVPICGILDYHMLIHPF
jgi:hypothetical protein